MAKVCSICIHPNRDAIDRSLIVDALSVRDLAGRHGLSKSSLDRHKAHASAALKRAKDVAEYRRGEKLLDRVEALHTRAVRISDKAEEEGEWGASISGVREGRSCLELVGRLTGELRDDKGDTTNNYLAILNFLRSPEAEEVLAPAAAVEIEGKDVGE